MGESTNACATLRFDRRVRLEFHGATITSDAGLVACRELDDALGLTETAEECLQESRGGRNVQHRLVGLLRQSVYSRLAGYEDTNDAERLAQDPTMRIIVGDRGIDRPAASTNTMSRFETEVLTQDGNVEGLGRLNAKKLSQNGKSPLATEPQECARKLQQSDVVRRLFVVAYQNSTALGEPCYSPFHNPPARRISLAPRTVQLLLADASDVWPIAVSGDGSTTRRIVIPLVQAQVLWVILGELRSFDHNRLQGLIQQRGVVGVGSGNHNAQWAALSFHKQAPLAASLAAIRWVGSNQIPPKRALPMAPSAACHSQSTPPNSSHCSTKALHIRRKTPSSTHR